MASVLILDADCPAGIECVQSLGRAGAEVFAAATDADALAFRSRYCTQGLIHPAHPDEILSWLIAQDRTHNFTLIIPATERALLVFAHPLCGETLRQKAVVASRASLLRAVDKENVLQLAKGLRIPTPPSVMASANALPPLPFSFPVAVKPVRSKQMSGDRLLDLRVSYAQNEQELQALLQEAPSQQFQVQKTVRGRGVGIELLFVHGEPVREFAHERIHELPLTGGGSSYRRSITPPADLLAYSIELLRALEWHGVAMVEWKVDPVDGAYLMEINPRLWGSLALAIDAGVDFPRDLLAVASGEALAPQTDYRVSYYTRDLVRDLNWQIANLRADHNNPQLLTRPRLQSALEFFRPLALQESWDFFDRHDLGITLERIRMFAREKLSAVQRKLERRTRRKELTQQIHPRIVQRLREPSQQPKQILFLCYGNICRSPLAALLARRALPGVAIVSAGFHEKTDRCSPEKLVRSAKRHGIDLAGHRSRQVTEADIASADVILVMDWKNYDQLLKLFPQAKSKVTFLGLFSSSPVLEIEDPYDLDGPRVDAVVDQISAAVDGLAQTTRSSSTGTSAPLRENAALDAGHL